MSRKQQKIHHGADVMSRGHEHVTGSVDGCRSRIQRAAQADSLRRRTVRHCERSYNLHQRFTGSRAAARREPQSPRASHSVRVNETHGLGNVRTRHARMAARRRNCSVVCRTRTVSEQCDALALAFSASSASPNLRRQMATSSPSRRCLTESSALQSVQSCDHDARSCLAPRRRVIAAVICAIKRRCRRRRCQRTHARRSCRRTRSARDTCFARAQMRAEVHHRRHRLSHNDKPR
eukprot:1876093-Pleurochrysis_carterae.AAC.4